MAVEKCMKTEEVESDAIFSDTSNFSYHTHEYVMYLKPVIMTPLDWFPLSKYMKEAKQI